MAKKLKDLKWSSVPIEGFPASITDNLQGFVGLEECTNYNLDKDSKRSKKKKQQKKRKNSSKSSETEVAFKKSKLSNGFIVETCESASPSLTNELPKNYSSTTEYNNSDKPITANNIKDAKNKQKSKQTKPNESNLKKSKLKLGESSETVSELTPEDMLSWAEFKLPESILNALAELGFKNPTKIQQLTLPAAIFGRRDILGAAETGSGKTLAFGLPILTGILKFKEKAEAGLDVYEIPYKKSSSKKKKENLEPNSRNKNKKRKKVDKYKEEEKKENSNGYASADEVDSNNGQSDDESENDEITESNDLESDGSQESNSSEDEDDSASTHSVNNDDNESFIEEIEVPIRKREESGDEGNETDDSDENYIHLSDMLDSDDLADSSDSEIAAKGTNISDKKEDNDEDSSDDDEGSDGDIENGKQESDEDKTDVIEGDEEVMDDAEGIGCVKVIDNIEIPSHMVVKTGKPLYALILTPTRELAIQISRHLIAAAKYTGIRVATIVGGMASVKQERVLRCGPEIVVATPGRLWELVNQGQPHLQQLHCVKFLAIDETDRMIERNHFEELQPLLERLNADEDRRGARQNFVFSATLTMVHDLPSHMKGKKVTKRGKIINRKIEKMTAQQKIKRLVNMIGMTDPKVVDITTVNLGTAETLTESMIACPLEHKDAYLLYVLKRHPGRTIVFCNSIGCVRRLAQLFTILRCKPLPLHASMPQRQRLKNLERFRDDPHGVLVATDVAARGLDIPDVDHVIHFQVPRTAENYVHRSGRTARANKEGLTILMMEPAEAYLYSKLCRTLNKTTSLPTFPVPPHLLAPLKELATIARDVDALELKKRRAAQSVGWRDKVARDMDMILDDDDVPVKHADASIERSIKAKKRQLNALLSRPLFPKGFSFKYPTLNDPNALNWHDDNALQVMKKAIESGSLKKEKRKSKNAPLLKLEKAFKKQL